MIKSAFFDFDYTLYSHKAKCIPESTKKAIKALQSNGIKCYLATGRAIWELIEFPELYNLGLDGYSMCEGQLILDKDRKYVYEKYICEEDKKQIVQLFNENKIPTILMTNKSMYINFLDDYVKEALKNISSSNPQIKKYEGEEIFYAAPYIPRGNDEALSARVPNCRLVRWGETGVDIIPKDSNKYTGILKCLEIFNLGTEFLAFGDEDNDFDMIQGATIGVAMGNACQHLKDAADYVTTDIDNDGIWNAVVNLGLV